MSSAAVKLAMIGSGPSALYLLKHVLDEVSLLKRHLEEIVVFEKSPFLGMGMPYNPVTTDRFNLANIASEEMPPLYEALVDWLGGLDARDLEEMRVEPGGIDPGKIYPRLVLGRYLRAQYLRITGLLREEGIRVTEHPECEVRDLIDDPEAGGVRVITAAGGAGIFQRVIVATGHQWTGHDKPESGYHASPWPMSKLLPREGSYHDFAVGTLGASLSAFDVINSLAHRHGRFVHRDGHLSYTPLPGTGNFKLIMHAMHGLLPHLQFAQVEPRRDIYRHVGRDGLIRLLDERGFLRLATYFDRVCRPALVEAFAKDGMNEMAGKLADPDYSLSDFVEAMTEKHDYPDPFEGMRGEMVEARQSVLRDRPIHWKEVIDDLMYTLNFHAELMPAEDHQQLRSLVMPFLMNVIAAMPLESGRILLALHDAGKVELVPGKATVCDEPDEEGTTTLVIEDADGMVTRTSYRMFIDCGGQKPLELSDYPFPGLVAGDCLRVARARFVDPAAAEACGEDLLEEEGETLYLLGGVDIDSTYRLVGRDGKGNPRISDIAFPHASGLRPYSYGLQACSDTAAIVVRAWVEELQSGLPVEGGPLELSHIYETL